MDKAMTLDPPTQELVAAAQAGDAAARSMLAERYRDHMERYIRQRVGPHLREVVEVDDFLQETMAAAFESLSAFRGQGEDSFLRWLKNIAENRVLALAKRRRANRIIYVADKEVPADGISPSRGGDAPRTP